MGRCVGVGVGGGGGGASGGKKMAFEQLAASCRHATRAALLSVMPSLARPHWGSVAVIWPVCIHGPARQFASGAGGAVRTAALVARPRSGPSPLRDASNGPTPGTPLTPPPGSPAVKWASAATSAAAAAGPIGRRRFPHFPPHLGAPPPTHPFSRGAGEQAAPAQAALGAGGGGGRAAAASRALTCVFVFQRRPYTRPPWRKLPLRVLVPPTPSAIMPS